MVLVPQKETLKILAKYNIPTTVSEIHTKTSALKTKLKFPVVLKALSEKIVHKTDAGAVVTGIENRTELEQKLKSISSRIKFVDLKFLLQKQESGKEVIIGMKRDAQFGPVILFGLGGVFVEVYKDVSFRVAPLSQKDIKDMMNEVKAIKILKGVRGEKAVNIKALADILKKISLLSIKEKDITEIDFNPVIVNEKKAVVVDARLIR